MWRASCSGLPCVTEVPPTPTDIYQLAVCGIGKKDDGKASTHSDLEQWLESEPETVCGKEEERKRKWAKMEGTGMISQICSHANNCPQRVARELPHWK